MRQRSRALVELSGWLAQHVEKFFALCPASDEFGGDSHGIRKPLEQLDGRAIDPSFSWSEDYRLRIFPDVITTRPRPLLPPGRGIEDLDDAEIHYTFAIWTQLRPDASPAIGSSSPLEGNVKLMWRHILPDLHSLGSSEGVARRRLARLAAELEQRIRGRSFLHLATVESATNMEYAHDLVSVFVDLGSLERVARLID